MKRSLLILFLLIGGLLNVLPLSAQNSAGTAIYGVVKNEEGSPLPGAYVLIDNKDDGATTNAEGRFSITDLNPGTYTLSVDFVGYEKATRQINIDAGQQKQIKIVLNSNTQTMQEVNIVGKSQTTRINEQAYAVSAIDTKELQNNTGDLNQVLNETSGVNVRQDGGLGSGFSFSLNGFSGRQVKFFLNGIPMENFGSSLSLNNIPVNVADHIEVYKGVVPVWLGADALGGAVNIVTNQKNRNYLDASYSYGSFNTHRSSVNAAYTDETSGFTARINAFHNYSDNNYTVDDVLVPREDNSLSRQSQERFHDTYQSKTLKFENGVVDKPWADELLAGIILSENENDIQTGATMDAVYGMRRRNSNTVMPNIRYRKDSFLVDGLSISAYGAYNGGTSQTIDTADRQYYWDGSYKQKPNPDAGEEDKTMYKFNDNLLLARTNMRYAINNYHQLSFNYVFSSFDRVGHDPVWPDNDEYEQPRIINKNILGLGYKFEIPNLFSANVFAKQFISEGKSFEYVDRYTSNARYVQISNNFSSPGYGLALSYYPLKALQLKLSYERAYRLPDGYEMFGNGVTHEGNPQLNPEASHNINAGVRYSYRLNTRNRITAEGRFIYRNAEGFMRTEVNGPYTRTINQRSVRNTGFEADFGYTYKSFLKVGINATYQHLINTTKYEEEGDQHVSTVYLDRLPNIPYLFGNANATFRFKEIISGYDRLSLRYNLHFVEEYYLKWPSLGSRQSKKIIPRQLSHDLSATYSLKNGKYNLSLECRNVTDRNLYDNYRLQNPGRAFYIKGRYFISK